MTRRQVCSWKGVTGQEGKLCPRTQYTVFGPFSLLKELEKIKLESASQKNSCSFSMLPVSFQLRKQLVIDALSGCNSQPLWGYIHTYTYTYKHTHTQEQLTYCQHQKSVSSASANAAKHSRQQDCPTNGEQPHCNRFQRICTHSRPSS